MLLFSDFIIICASFRFEKTFARIYFVIEIPIFHPFSLTNSKQGPLWGHGCVCVCVCMWCVCVCVWGGGMWNGSSRFSCENLITSCQTSRIYNPEMQSKSCELSFSEEWLSNIAENVNLQHHRLENLRSCDISLCHNKNRKYDRTFPVRYTQVDEN